MVTSMNLTGLICMSSTCVYTLQRRSVKMHNMKTRLIYFQYGEIRSTIESDMILKHLGQDGSASMDSKGMYYCKYCKVLPR